MPKDALQPVEVILVHGTLPPWQWWNRVESAAEARRLFPWTDAAEEDSLAARIAALRNEGFRISHSVLPWRGSNASAAREEGAARLADVLQATPERLKLLVAHSHGGNVAIRALQRAGSPKSVLGVVCMATPFLQILPRDPHGILWLRSIGLLSVLLAELLFRLMAVGIVLVGVVGAIHSLRGQPVEGLSLALCGIFAGAGALAWLALNWFHRALALRKDHEAEQHTLTKQEEALGDHTEPVDTPCLCVHAAGDEAGAWLRLTSVISGLASVLRNRLVASLAVVTLVALAFATFGLGWTPSDDEGMTIRIGLSLALWLSLAAGAYFLLTALALTAAWAFEALPLTFGSRGRSWHLTHTTVSLTPIYARNTEFKAYTGKTLLLHSIYTSEEVQADVVKWIGERLASAPKETRT